MSVLPWGQANELALYCRIGTFHAAIRSPRDRSRRGTKIPSSHLGRGTRWNDGLRPRTGGIRVGRFPIKGLLRARPRKQNGQIPTPNGSRLVQSGNFLLPPPPNRRQDEEAGHNHRRTQWKAGTASSSAWQERTQRPSSRHRREGCRRRWGGGRSRRRLLLRWWRRRWLRGTRRHRLPRRALLCRSPHIRPGSQSYHHYPQNHDPEYNSFHREYHHPFGLFYHICQKSPAKPAGGISIRRRVDDLDDDVGIELEFKRQRFPVNRVRKRPGCQQPSARRKDNRQ
jgi:hypothetical protein